MNPIAKKIQITLEKLLENTILAYEPKPRVNIKLEKKKNTSK